ncbi:hypothetical protein [Bartonella sp. F02]|uniref:hypothetical protein n=1 Tax=Bartonella sp. F02 TaxID=2967262 RepID=UPI0022A9D9E3|nr:hypothetical protein [Bartonella sp. F02]MCZ2328852.1 hypothetical protein [Bartonella sp. F02]
MNIKHFVFLLAITYNLPTIGHAYSQTTEINERPIVATVHGVGPYCNEKFHGLLQPISLFISPQKVGNIWEKVKNVYLQGEIILSGFSKMAHTVIDYIDARLQTNKTNKTNDTNET